MDTQQVKVDRLYQQRDNGTPRLYSVRQFSEKHPAFPEGGIRHLIYHESTNGFKDAFLRIGKKRLIDEAAFFRVLLEKNGGEFSAK